MRRLRLMSREEHLIRETVRGMLQEVDPEIERLSKMLRVPAQKKGSLEDTATNVGVVSDIMGALANFGGSNPAAVAVNVTADIISVTSANYLVKKEIRRGNIAMTALKRLRAMNDFHYDASGSYTYDPEDLEKFELFYIARETIAATQFLLSVIAAVSSLLGLLPGLGGGTSGASLTEWAMKGGKLGLVAITAADAAGVIDLAQTMTDILETIKKAWTMISSKSEYAAIVNTYAPKVAEIFSNPSTGTAIVTALLSLHPSARSFAVDISQCVSILATSLPKLQAARG